MDFRSRIQSWFQFLRVLAVFCWSLLVWLVFSMYRTCGSLPVFAGLWWSSWLLPIWLVFTGLSGPCWSFRLSGLASVCWSVLLCTSLVGCCQSGWSLPVLAGLPSLPVSLVGFYCCCGSLQVFRDLAGLASSCLSSSCWFIPHTAGWDTIFSHMYLLVRYISLKF